MKRFHVCVTVYDIASNVEFYSSLFGSSPAGLEPHYAEWSLEEPRLNFAISSRGKTPGVDRLGIQPSTDQELDAMRRRLARLDPFVIDEPRTTCCATVCDNHWVIDPQGIVWQAFRKRIRPTAGAPLAAPTGSSGGR